jgi:hypothetical protein
VLMSFVIHDLLIRERERERDQDRQTEREREREKERERERERVFGTNFITLFSVAALLHRITEWFPRERERDMHLFSYYLSALTS